MAKWPWSLIRLGRQLACLSGPPNSRKERVDMKFFSGALKLVVGLAILLVASTGCETTDGGGGAAVGVYYGVGFYDPWYYGGYYDDPDIIVTPPDRPDRPSDRPRPEHPI